MTYQCNILCGPGGLFLAAIMVFSQPCIHNHNGFPLACMLE